MVPKRSPRVGAHGPMVDNYWPFLQVLRASIRLRHGPSTRTRSPSCLTFCLDRRVPTEWLLPGRRHFPDRQPGSGGHALRWRPRSRQPPAKCGPSEKRCPVRALRLRKNVWLLHESSIRVRGDDALWWQISRTPARERRCLQRSLVLTEIRFRCPPVQPRDWPRCISARHI